MYKGDWLSSFQMVLRIRHKTQNLLLLWILRYILSRYHAHGGKETLFRLITYTCTCNTNNLFLEKSKKVYTLFTVLKINLGNRSTKTLYSYMPEFDRLFKLNSQRTTQYSPMLHWCRILGRSSLLYSHLNKRFYSTPPPPPPPPTPRADRCFKKEN